MASPLYAVIGDLIGSRRISDRIAVHRALTRSLAEVNDLLKPAHPFAVTVGDEYQGACGSLGDAVLAATLVRLTLLPDVDVRCGIGYGAVMVHDAKERAVVQDGPGWWTAREAIDIVGRARDSRRSWYVGDGSGTVNAFLLCRDQVIARLNDRGVRMLRLALLGRNQKQIAEVEGIWPSAVSQQFARGVGAVVEAQELITNAAG
jgi:SatD family (SatD)